MYTSQWWIGEPATTLIYQGTLTPTASDFGLFCYSYYRIGGLWRWCVRSDTFVLFGPEVRTTTNQSLSLRIRSYEFLLVATLSVIQALWYKYIRVPISSSNCHSVRFCCWHLGREEKRNRYIEILQWHSLIRFRYIRRSFSENIEGQEALVTSKKISHRPTSFFMFYFITRVISYNSPWYHSSSPLYLVSWRSMGALISG